MQISKDTVIGTILDSAPETAPFFLEMGMHCLGCPSARSETVAQACMVHGVNADDLVSKINAFLAISFAAFGVAPKSSTGAFVCSGTTFTKDKSGPSSLISFSLKLDIIPGALIFACSKSSSPNALISGYFAPLP